MNTNKHEYAETLKRDHAKIHAEQSFLAIKTYSAPCADLTLAAGVISRARIAMFKASDPDELRRSALLDIHALAKVRVDTVPKAQSDDFGGSGPE